MNVDEKSPALMPHIAVENVFTHKYISGCIFRKNTPADLVAILFESSLHIYSSSLDTMFILLLHQFCQEQNCLTWGY